ncbi:MULTISPECIES: ribose-phosphate diphosphokinase [Gimesia]|jgi:ribose-phosphate pyrophosphokinase|uniref:Ribose-phosphate pyrophosphokinase n=1 Tax=Gimesia maris TaxID=122 RepID=A0A3D3QZE0_9PLAN|nr:ribose-phosphate pyrophosphokinase [Gimesia maris]MAC54063.1 ribose-phosphate pyrophosphokinase [Gimesia sp.]MCA9005498.1 ribose-phosphate pyrophosphokinase [Planctomycetaceae bacterium]EDL62005.1 ribose-phosphate pyrophosphokinase [Gimesia maris DSM 8797]QDT80690.1 Ribose-phosphate pyrophosphokinase [Gimesia maris]QDU16401.1 Ribose-phosphate pyrophosphokinase [Gimesia maris]|tara:strand:- start:75566 stop:76513 length:948 start_codon:yes stop_codon:yes gene_type:complete
MYDHLTLLSGRAHPQLAGEIAEYLGIRLASVELSNFPDGEISLKLNQNVRGRDVFIVQPTSPPVNDNLMELLILMDACRRASAERITAVIPYFGYARQDRKDSGRVPITSKLVANLINEAGADRVLAMDLHAAQIQGFFDTPVDHLYAAPILDRYFRSLNIPDKDLVVVSPDEGSIKRTLQHNNNIGGTLAIVDKRRKNAIETQQANIIGGPIEGKVALLFDDMISTGGSIVGAVNVVKEQGAKEIYVGASHAVFCGPAIKLLSEAPIKEIVVTNSLPIPDQDKLSNLRTISIAPLLGEAIRRIHRNESVSHLFD